jgi:hypothetical protein
MSIKGENQQDLDAETRARLALAARIAGGMAANPEIYAQRDWRGELARDAWDVAGRLLMLARTGGC